MRIGTLACVISCITSVVAIPADAHAQSPSDAPAQAPARARVLVKIAGAPADVEATTTVLRERIADANADASGTIEPATKIDRSEVLAPILQDTGELARVWLDLSSDPLVVYIVDGAGKRVLVREVPRGTNPEVAREEIGHIVETALIALRAGESIGVERAELARAEAPPPSAPTAPPPPTGSSGTNPTPPPEPPVTPRWGFVPSLYFGLRGYGDGPEISSGPGLSVSVLRRSERFGFGAGLAGEYRFPALVESTAANVRFEGFAFYFLARAELALDRKRVHLLSFSAGPGLELVDAEPRDARSASAALTDEKTRREALLRWIASYGLATPWFRVFAGLGVDVPMRNPRYVLLVQGETIRLFVPWSVRPLLVVGIETN